MAKRNMNISSDEETQHAETKGGYEPGDYSFQIMKTEDVTAPSGNEGCNITFKAIRGTIKFTVFDGPVTHPKAVPAGTSRLHTFDLGTKNKITSITWNGIDTGGSNASMTFSYRNFNKLDYIFGSADGDAKGTDVPYPT